MGDPSSSNLVIHRALQRLLVSVSDVTLRSDGSLFLPQTPVKCIKAIFMVICGPCARLSGQWPHPDVSGVPQPVTGL